MLVFGNNWTMRRGWPAILLAVVVVAGGIGRAAALDVGDVKNLIQNKVSEDVIINMVKTDGTIYITPEEAAMFRSMGASENLIAALRPTPYMATPSASAPPAAAAASAPAKGYRPPKVISPSQPSAQAAPVQQPAPPAPSVTVVQSAPAPTVVSSGTAEGSPIVPAEVAMSSAYPALYHKEGWLSVYNRDWTTYYLSINVDKEKMFLSKVPNGGMAIDSGQNVIVNIRKHDYKLYGDSGKDLKVNVREGETTTLSLNPFGVFGNSGLTGVATDRDKVRSEVLFYAYSPAPTVIVEQPPVVVQPPVVIEQPPVYVVPGPRYYRPYYYGPGPRYYRGGSGMYFNFDW